MVQRIGIYPKILAAAVATTDARLTRLADKGRLVDRRSQTLPAASTTTLPGVVEVCAALGVGKFSNLQTSGPGGNVEKFLRTRMAQSVFGGRFPRMGKSLQARRYAEAKFQKKTQQHQVRPTFTRSGARQSRGLE